MLHYFPTPYPDELWYSVLCRYHVRTGNPNSAMTFRDLLGNRDNAPLTSFLPNGMICKVAEQLPDGVLDVGDIALNHTLFKYVFRFQPLETKQRLLQMTRYGRVDFPVRQSKPYNFRELKACPVCMREDFEQYGEAYWHLSHQVPYVPVCPKHKCRLKIRSGEKEKELNSNFILPDFKDMDSVDTHVTQTELELTDMLVSYLNLPLEAGPTEGYSNLYEGILNAGYGTVRKDNYFSIDYEKVEKGLWDMFGKEMIAHHFGSANMRAAIFGSIRHWKYKMPERYAILAVFIKQEPETTFSHTRIENDIIRRFMDMSRSSIIRSKKYVAEKLGVKEMHLDVISHNLGVKPFWEHRPRTDNPKDYKLALNLTKDEWDYVNACVDEFGFPSASAFIRFCIGEERERKDVVRVS